MEEIKCPICGEPTYLHYSKPRKDLFMKYIKIIVSILLVLSVIIGCTSCDYRIVKIENENDANANNNTNNNINNDQENQDEQSTIKNPIYLTPNNYNDYLVIENKTTARETESQNYKGTEWVDVTATFKVIPKKEDYIFINSFIIVRITLYEKNIDTTLKIEIDNYGYGVNSITLTPNEPYPDFESIKLGYQINTTAGTIENSKNPERIDENKYILIGNNNYSDYLKIDWNYNLAEWGISAFGSGYKNFTVTQNASGLYDNYVYKDVHLQIKVQITTRVTKKGLFNDKTRIEEYPIWVYDLKTSADGKFERTYTYNATQENGEFLLSASDVIFTICKINVVSGYLIRK